MTAWLTKAATPVLIGLGLLALIALLSFWTVNGVTDWLETYRTRIEDDRDTYWKGQIADANLETARTQAAQFQKVISLESEAQEKIKAADDRQAEMEKQNAALPNSDSCGIDIGRVRLLNQQ